MVGNEQDQEIERLRAEVARLRKLLGGVGALVALAADVVPVQGDDGLAPIVVE